MSEQEKKRQRIYNLLIAETKLTFLCLPYTKQWKNLQKKKFKEKRSTGLDKNEKKAFKPLLLRRLKRTPISSIRKHDNELNFHQKTLTTAIIQDFNLRP